MHCSSRDAQSYIADAQGMTQVCSSDESAVTKCAQVDSSVLKLRKLCAELIPRFDLFAMPAAGPTTEAPKSKEVKKHVTIFEDANRRKRLKGSWMTTEGVVPQVADEHAPTSICNANIAEAAESVILNHIDDDEQRAARNSISKDTTKVKDGSSCWNSLLCSRCGKFLVNHRKSVRRGLCCNKCPNHGPWCTSNANLTASSLLDGCENLPPAVPSSYRRGTQSDRMPIAKDLLAGRYHGSWSMRAEEDGEGEA